MIAGLLNRGIFHQRLGKVNSEFVRPSTSMGFKSLGAQKLLVCSREAEKWAPETWTNWYLTKNDGPWRRCFILTASNMAMFKCWVSLCQSSGKGLRGTKHHQTYILKNSRFWTQKWRIGSDDFPDCNRVIPRKLQHTPGAHRSAIPLPNYERIPFTTFW